MARSSSRGRGRQAVHAERPEPGHRTPAKRKRQPGKRTTADAAAEDSTPSGKEEQGSTLSAVLAVLGVVGSCLQLAQKMPKGLGWLVPAIVVATVVVVTVRRHRLSRAKILLLVAFSAASLLISLLVLMKAPVVEISRPITDSTVDFASVRLSVEGTAEGAKDGDFVEIWATPMGNNPWCLAAGPIQAEALGPDGSWAMPLELCAMKIGSDDGTLVIRAAIVRSPRNRGTQVVNPFKGVTASSAPVLVHRPPEVIAGAHRGLPASVSGVATPAAPSPAPECPTFEVVSPPDGATFSLSAQPHLLIQGKGACKNCEIEASLRAGGADSCLERQVQEGTEPGVWQVDCTLPLFRADHYSVWARRSCPEGGDAVEEHALTVVP